MNLLTIGQSNFGFLTGPQTNVALLSQGARQIWTSRTLASARARGVLPEGMLAHLGGRQVHIPDLVATLPDGRRVAYEVEMSRKSPRRLADIMRAYRLARGLDEVVYLAPVEARARAIALAEAALKIREEIEDPNAEMVHRRLAEWRGKAEPE